MDLPRARTIARQYGSTNKPIIAEGLRFALAALDTEQTNHASTLSENADLAQQLRGMTSEHDKAVARIEQLEADLVRLADERVKEQRLGIQAPTERFVLEVPELGDPELDAMAAIVEALDALTVDGATRRVVSYVWARFGS
jgi:hypothetical protein